MRLTHFGSPLLAKRVVEGRVGVVERFLRWVRRTR